MANHQDAFKRFSMREHAQKKGMWAGAVTKAHIENLMGASREDGEWKTVPILVEQTPALLKGFDELIVNATDHAKTSAGKDKVTYIKVTYSQARGIFEIENDGPGIPIVKHEQTSAELGRDVYIPEIAMCHFLSGSNMEKPKDSIKGGINGVGAKIANVHSDCFRCITVTAHGSKRLFYSQRSRDHLKVIDPPRIMTEKTWQPTAEYKAFPPPLTRVTMLPAYRALGYGLNKDLSVLDADFKAISSWLALRCLQVAAYVPGVRVEYNGEVCDSSPEALGWVYLRGMLPPELLGSTLVVEAPMKAKESPYKEHPMQVAVFVNPAIKKFAHLSIVNGVVTSKGPHITHMKSCLKDAAVKKIADKNLKTTVTEVCKHVFAVIISAIPGADWGGQRKDELNISTKVTNLYAFPPKQLTLLGARIASVLLLGRGNKKTKAKLEKYRKARRAGAGSKAKLLVAEGDSALQLIKAGKLSQDYYGTYSLQGVILNAAREVEYLESQNGNTILVRKQKLRDNEVLNGLNQVLNLNHDLTYATDKEARTLHYSTLVACVDQDVDGAGKILGLLLTYFNLFWPELIRRGFVKWFMTPVVRVYPARCKTSGDRAAAAKKGELKEFFHESQYEEWVASFAEGGGLANELMSKEWTPRYYKGLGCHDDPEIPLMFSDFDKKLYRFELDGEAPNLFKVYFGPDSEPRKVALREPLVDIPAEELARYDEERFFPCSKQLTTFAKAYKHDAIGRQIPCGIDGLTESRRKILAGAILRFSRSKQDCRTFQAAGNIADKMGYHHGNASLENTITIMTQKFPGARTFNLLIGVGQMGSRAEGGKDAASPRYTSVTINDALVKALFPPADYPLLPRATIDGQKVEPRFFVPVVPLCAMERMETPSEGWRYKAFARDYDDVAAVIRAYLDPDDPNHRWTIAGANHATDLKVGFESLRAAFPMRPSLHGFKGSVEGVYHVGEYSYDRSTRCVTITELPIGVWTNRYIEWLTKPTKQKTGKEKPPKLAPYIDNVEDDSGKNEVHIRVYLSAEGVKKLDADSRTARGGRLDDPIIQMFNLKRSLESDLNVVRATSDGSGGVLEFKGDYLRLVFYHLGVRKHLYKLRFEREEAVLTVRIREQKEILRYIVNAAALNLSKQKDESTAIELLKEHKYPQIRASPLDTAAGHTFAAGDIPTKEIALLIAESDSPRVLPSGYGYILNLRERDLVEAARRKREEKLAGYEQRLAQVREILAEKPFAGVSVWRAELEAFERVARGQNLI